MQLLTTSVGTFLICSLLATANAEDWREFRGPNASGVSTAPQLPTLWDANANIRWQASIPGSGWSAPVVANGRVFVTTAVNNEQTGDKSIHRWEVHCLDAESGESLWKQVAVQAIPRQGKHRDNTFASETPVTDGKYIVAYFGMMGVFCYDVEGELLWQKDLGSFPMKNDWGTSSSPTMHGGKVFLQIDNEQASFIVALDLKTGSEVWRQDRTEKSNWGSAVIWKNPLRTELITSGAIVRSYDPDSGKVLWQLDIGSGGGNSTPSANESVLVVGRGGRGGNSIFAVRPGAAGDISNMPVGEPDSSVLWSSSEVGPERSSPLVYQGYVYLLGGRGGQITCLDAKTGQTAFRSRLPKAGSFWASPWAHEGLVYCPDSDGNTFVIKPGSELEIVRTNVLPSNSSTRYWASAALSDNSIFIRSTNTVYAIGAR